MEDSLANVECGGPDEDGDEVILKSSSSSSDEEMKQNYSAGSYSLAAVSLFQKSYEYAGFS